MKKKGAFALQTMVKVALLGTLAAVVMLLEFPLPFIAPPFYQLDFSEIIVMLGAFSLGPVAGAAIEGVKIVVNLLLNASATFGVGEIANFIIGCSMIVPAGIIYKYRRTRTGAIIAMAAGTAIMVVVGCVMNAFVLLPFYAAAYGAPIESFIAAGSEINKSITNLFTFVVIAVAPFNLFKGVVTSVVTGLIYKKVSPLLKKTY